MVVTLFLPGVSSKLAKLYNISLDINRDFCSNGIVHFRKKPRLQPKKWMKSSLASYLCLRITPRPRLRPSSCTDPSPRPTLPFSFPSFLSLFLPIHPLRLCLTIGSPLPKLSSPEGLCTLFCRLVHFVIEILFQVIDKGRRIQYLTMGSASFLVERTIRTFWLWISCKLKFWFCTSLQRSIHWQFF